MVKVYIGLDDDNYVNGWGSLRSSEEDIKLALGEDHSFFSSDIYCWKYADGDLIFDEERKQHLIEQYEKENTKLSADDLNTLALFELAQEIEALRIENKRLREEE